MTNYLTQSLVQRRDFFYEEMEAYNTLRRFKMVTIYLSDEGRVVNYEGDEVTNISADSIYWMDDLKANGSLEVESCEEL